MSSGQWAGGSGQWGQGASQSIRAGGGDCPLPTAHCPLLLGAPYFNARPLVWEFIERPTPELNLIEETPARLADRVRAGELDAALISSIEAYRDAALDAWPGIGVASRGAVWSIKLFHARPLDRVLSVALDSSSRTSAALTRILLAERYDNAPEFVNAPPDLDAMLDRCDAALLIGDPSLRTTRADVPYVDLGEEWFQWTGLPFVYAVWAGKPGVFEGGLGARLTAALEYGQGRTDAIVEAEAGPRRLPPEVCHAYLRKIIRYRLGAEEEQGLIKFLQFAKAHGLLGAC